MALECQRLSLGHFERGPVRLLFDYWSHAFSEGCQRLESTFMSTGVLGSFWIDDPEVAALMESALGMAVYSRPIEASAQSAGTMNIHQWRWGLEGERLSEMTVTDSFGQGDNSPAPIRAFWFRGSGLGELEIHFDMTGPNQGGQPSYGVMQPPMALADDGRPFAWLSEWHESGSATGTFTLYEDLECGRVLP